MRKNIVIALVVLASLLSVPGLLAQSGLGTITGRVADPTGAVIPGAKIVVTNNASQTTVGTVSNDSGIYSVLNLTPGVYSVEASSPNFKTIRFSTILVQAEDKIGLDFKLEVGQMSETVTVSSEQSQLRKEDAQLGEVVTNSMIETLPTISGTNGRDPFSLIALAGNVQGDGKTRAGHSLGDGGSTVSGQGDLRINGGRTGSLEYLVDGIPATGGFVHNVVNNTPDIDSVQEFKVITNGISAEYGRLSGGLVSLSTKAGTDDFHGQLFEYNQNAYLNANSWSNDALCKSGSPSACAKPNFRRNDFGAAAGGPVIIPHIYNGREKTFWYADFDGIRQSTSGNTTIGQTITDLERTGDLTDIGVSANDANFPWARAYDPFGPAGPASIDADGNFLPTRADLLGGDGRHVPANRLDPVIQQYNKYLPHPNRAALGGSGTAENYTVNQPGSTYSNSWSVRLDQVINVNQRIFGRFSHNYLTDVTGAFYPTLGTSTGTLLNGGFGLELHYDYTINPTTILTLQSGGNFSPFSSGSFLPKSIQSSSFGYGPTVQSLLGTSDIVRIAQGPETEGSHASSCGNCQYSQGYDSNRGALVNTTNFVYSGALTKILNKHSLKFGYEGRRYYDNFTQNGQSNTSGGISDGYNFDSAAVSQHIGNNNAEVWSNAGQANGVAQYLLGVDAWVRITNKLGRSLASNYYAAYVQDDYKVLPNLTLNLGLRWETETPVTERHNNLTVWDPNAAPQFSSSSGFTWAGALGSAGIDPSQVRTPEWVTNGFSPGAILAVKTAQHPSRNANDYHVYNFAPRLGFAYQSNANTVIRGSFAALYLPTSGNLSSYGDTPGVYYTTTASNQSTQGPPGPNEGLPNVAPRTVEAPFDPSQITNFNQDNKQINAQAAASGVGVGGVSVHQHMPYELDWSLGFQHQFPNQWLLEITYSANWSDTLLTIGNPSHFPKVLYTGGPNGVNHALYAPTDSNGNSKLVASPTAGQIADNSKTGLLQPLGVLEYKYPYYGPVTVEGQNTGLSNYESVNVRAQRRFANGFQLLLNYTYGKLLDDTGGADTSLGNPGQGSGTGGKTFQQVDDSVKSTYGVDSYDESHRVSAFYNYQLPFGRGRRFLSDTSAFAGKALDAVAGGWELSGTTLYRSGRPIILNVQGAAVDQGTLYNFSTFGSLAPGFTVAQLKNAHPSHLVVPSGSAPAAEAVPFLNVNAIQGIPASSSNSAQPGVVQSFTYGNLPAAISAFRNPGFWSSDLSIMKSFALAKDASRYFQLRLESYNLFNHPGRGQYDQSTSDSTFGYITGTANPARSLQVGGRFVF